MLPFFHAVVLARAVWATVTGFARRHPRLLTTLAVLVALLLAEWHGRRVAHEADALEARASQTAALDSARHALERHAARVDTVARVDSVAFVRWRTAYDTTHDTVTVEHVVYVRKSEADATIGKCTEAFTSCEARVAARDAIIANLHERVTADSVNAAHAAHVSRMARLQDALLGAAAGVVLDRVTH